MQHLSTVKTMEKLLKEWLRYRLFRAQRWHVQFSQF